MANLAIKDIAVAPSVSAASIKAEIINALRRRADLEAACIDVEVQDGCHIVLEGLARDWSERAAVEHAVECTRGVQSVDNRIRVVPRLHEFT